MKRAGRPCWLRSPCTLCYLLLLSALTVAAYIGIDWYLGDLRDTSRSVNLSAEENIDFRSEIASKLRELTKQIQCRELDLYNLKELNVITGFGIDWYLADPLRVTSRSVDLSAEENIDFRFEIASKLQDLTRQIRYEAKNINPTILQELNKIISQLDPRYALSTDSLLADPSPIPDTCGEVFNGTLFGYPWYRTGFVESPSCKKEEKQPIHKLITIILLDRVEDINKTCDVLQTIRSYNSNIKVILGSTASLEAVRTIKAKYKNIITVTSDHEDMLRPGKILNLMVERIKTPYVLVARDIFYFNDLARLERQVFVISSTNVVGIAGGAFRNESGYWKVGCHLSQIKNYFLQYTEGYKYSALDCMLCDHLEGPFIAKTSVMRSIPFKKNLYEEVLYEDWFLRVKQNNILTMNCPDVMYFKRGLMEGVSEEVKLREYSSWLDLAREWQVDHVHFPSRVSMKFTCKDLKITCDSTRWFKAFLIPTCCMKQITGALQALDTFSEEKGVDYEIEAGTLLGAVKLRNFLPWDKDGDITFQIKDYDIFYENSDFFSEKGFSLSMFKKNKYFRLNTPEIILEMWGSDKTSTYQLPTEMWEYPTRVKFNGIWVRGEWNPGLFARNRYGPGFLKHVQHWNLMNMPDSWQIYKPGSWKSCPKKAHHACLDQYPSDGSEGLLSKPEA